MDPQLSAQDALRCDLCETPVPPMYCDLCHVKLCKACVGEHLSDLSKEHKVVPFTQKGTTPKCPIHVGKLCELHCKECDLPVCSVCLSSNFHKGHTLLNLLERIKIKQKAMQKDFDELSNSVCPKFEEMSAEIQREKTNLEKHYRKLTTAVTKQGEEWHREINNIVNKQKSEIYKIKTQHLAILDKQENEIKHIISELKQYVLDLEKIMESNDVSQTSVYKSRNAEFRILPPRVKVSLPGFSPQTMSADTLHQMFGSLSALSITTDEHDFTMETQEAASCPPVKQLLEKPKLTSTIDTCYGLQHRLKGVICLNNEKIWTHGDNKIMKFYNIQGNLLKSIQTKSGNTPWDIAVTRSGDLVYTDPDTRTVNIVKNDQIQEVIRLQGWKPYNICITSSDDLLVTMNSDDKQSKVVRYSGSTEKQIIQFDSKGKPLFSSYDIKYISENRNLDICVADWEARAVVVVNQAGILRFRYTGHPSTTRASFFPYGITTDSQCQILTSDCDNHCIDILDQDGQFLCFIDYCDLRYPWGLCVDTRDNLFVAEHISGKVKKIKYM